jgi:hypothetical protein
MTQLRRAGATTFLMVSFSVSPSSTSLAISSSTFAFSRALSTRLFQERSEILDLTTTNRGDFGSYIRAVDHATSPGGK